MKATGKAAREAAAQMRRWAAMLEEFVDPPPGVELRIERDEVRAMGKMWRTMADSLDPPPPTKIETLQS